MLYRRSFLLGSSAAAIVAASAQFSANAADTVWCPEAREWFGKAGLANEHRHIGDAVNGFVADLKRGGIWDKFAALYLPAHVMPTERAALTRLI